MIVNRVCLDLLLHNCHPTMVRRTTSLLALLVGLAVLGVGLTGCDSSDPARDDAPRVIDPAAFQTDIESFGTASTSNLESKAGSNFTRSALTVGLVSVVIEANLVIPQAMTAAALNEDPMVDDGTWIWESTTTYTGADGTEKTATFRLEGTPDGESVDWEMYVSSTEGPNGNALENFVLYTATTAFDGSNGTWELFYPVEGQRVNVLDAEFTADSESSKSVTFSVPAGIGEGGGDAVRYTTQDVQRSFAYNRNEPAENIVIEWNAETKAGSIQATDYNNGQRACWGPAPELANVPCE